MEPYRLKIKVGIHEFEAEGEQEAVERQFQAFQDLIKGQSLTVNVPSTPVAPLPMDNSFGPIPQTIFVDKGFDAIFKIEDRVVSLTATAKSTNDAALLIMLGQKHYRENDQVTGSEVMNGLRVSGISISRADYILDKFCDEGLMMKSGQRRATRYRLTNSGLAKAKELAADLMKVLA